MPKKKILISVTYLKEIGGISTAAVNLLNEIHDKYDITLCVPCDFISEKYQLPNDIKVISGSKYLCDIITDRKFLWQQSLLRKMIRNIRRLSNHYIFRGRLIPKALKEIKVAGEYDAAIAFADFAYNSKQRKCFDYEIVLNQVRAKKKIAWIHNDPEKLGWDKSLIEQKLSGFDTIVNVSKYGKKIFDEMAPQFSKKSSVVYNFYNIEKIKYLSTQFQNPFANNGKIHFVTVARIQREQKRIDRIIYTCKRLSKAGYKNFDWTLVGSSSEIEYLKNLVSELGLSSIIKFAGLQKNPYPYFRYADASVLSSEYEGLSMTLRESQILYTPILLTNFGAAKEAVENGKQGIICDNNKEAFYNMIKSVLDKPICLSIYREYLKKNQISNEVALHQFDSLL